MPEITGELLSNNIQKIYVYGSTDKEILAKNFFVIGKKEEYKSVIHKITDIQPYLNSVLPPLKEDNCWGLTQVCKYFNIPTPKHNALSDAETLAKIVEKYNSNFVNTYYYKRLLITSKENNTYLGIKK